MVISKICQYITTTKIYSYVLSIFKMHCDGQIEGSTLHVLYNLYVLLVYTKSYIPKLTYIVLTAFNSEYIVQYTKVVHT